MGFGQTCSLKNEADKSNSRRVKDNIMQKNHFKIGIIVIILAWAVILQDAASAAEPDFQVIIGEWVRPDGGYIIRIRNIDPEGRIDLGYFNPREINVSEANVSVQKGLLKLFIKLQDRGYPGSTYTLYYYAEKDALAGFYYQAAIKQKFEVVFIRKPDR
jgi:hypothetical protein